METLVPVSVCRSATIRVATQRATEFVDVTDCLKRFVEEVGIEVGVVNVQTLHTTTAIVVNEHEPLLLADFTELLERTAPHAASYRHDDMAARRVNLGPDERINGHAHCRALVLPPSAGLNVDGGRLVLGRWQRVFLAELDGPQMRELSVVAMGEARR
jgi:secondary thiamine-phosphate synthase enzyme